jgi:predicted phage terminase large subunit-like protein
VILASYASDLAEKFSSQVRGLLWDDRYRQIFPNVTVDKKRATVEVWDVAGRRGGFKAVGVGGPVTGHGANLLLLDDIIKNRDEAKSETIRNRDYDWYTSTAYTRLEKDGAVVIVMTRWHEDDLVGRLLQMMDKVPGSDQWEILHLPAISSDNQALWEDKYDLKALNQIRNNIGEYDWQSLYMGTPTSKEGALFEIAKIGVVSKVPEGLRSCRGWDIAATSNGDWTAGVKLCGPDLDGLWYIEDVVREQLLTTERNRLMMQTALMDGEECTIRVPQDPGQAGKDQAEQFTRMFAGFKFRTKRMSGSKETRAEAFQSMVGAGKVRMKRATWNRDYLEELRSFPMGKNDDQVDATSDAFWELTLRRTISAFTIGSSYVSG